MQLDYNLFFAVFEMKLFDAINKSYQQIFPRSAVFTNGDSTKSHNHKSSLHTQISKSAHESHNFAAPSRQHDAIVMSVVCGAAFWNGRKLVNELCDPTDSTLRG